MSTRLCALGAIGLLIPAMAGRAQQPAAPAAPPVPHYDQARDEDVIVQIMGPGPVKTVQSEVDEKGQPVRR